MVDAAGNLVWANRRLKRQSAQVQREFAEHCKQAIEQFRGPTLDEHGKPRRLIDRFEFQVDPCSYELVVCPVSMRETDEQQIAAVVGVLWDVTASRRLQNRIDAIDAAGADLMKIDAAQLAGMNMAQRLKWLEEKIVRYVRELLNFDNFEVRLLDKQTGQLELVIAHGIAPLKIGEVMFAREDGNGISGWVATSGRSYICPDVRRDPLYREGLDNARSSLTVPLFLHDRVVGTFNAESFTPNVFDENDRRFAEIFGRYIAMAMNVLDIMVAERYMTNEQVAQNIVREVEEPLEDVAGAARGLLERIPVGDESRAELERILRAAESVRDRIAACARGPRTILGAEQELRRHEIDPLIAGKRVIVADDEPNIRETISAILSQKGAEVTVCENGVDTIEAIERAGAEGQLFELVISDIKMPDRNGYEVFRAAKAINPHTPVILMTGFGYDPHHSIVRSSQEGLDLFLFKPFKASQLMEAIAKSLQPAE
jgi:two-component system, sensor histidine kinase SagS